MKFFSIKIDAIKRILNLPRILAYFFVFLLVSFKGQAAQTDRSDLPQIDLTVDILYQFVAADIAYLNDEHLLAYNTIAHLAEKTGDPRLARKALEYSVGTNSLALLADAAINWQRFDRFNVESMQTYYKVQSLITSTPNVGTSIGEFFKTFNQDESDALEKIENISYYFKKDQRIPFLEQALKKFENNAQAKVIMLKAQYDAKQTDVALQKLEELLKSTPKNPDLLNAALQLQTEPSEEFVHQIEAYMAENQKPTELVFAWLDYLISNQRYTTGSALINVLLSYNPEHYNLLYYQAKINAQQKNFVEALSNIQKAKMALPPLLENQTISPLEFQDHSDRFTFLHSVILEKSGQLKEAIAILESHPWTYNKITAAQRVAYLLSLQTKSPNESINYLNRVQILSQLEDVEIGHAKIAIYQNYQQSAKAMAILEELIKKYPDDLLLQYDAGILAAEMKQYKKAIQYFRQVVKDNPNFSQGLNALGYTMLEAKADPKEALTYIQKAIELTPNDAAITDSLGWAYFALGKYDLAEEALFKAYQLSPRLDIALHYAEVLWKRKKTAELKAFVEEIKNNYEPTPEIKSFLKRIGY